MTDQKKCLYCGVEVPQTPGKRERKFCSPSHTTMYHNKKKNEGKEPGKRGRKPGSKNKFKVKYIDPQPTQEPIPNTFTYEMTIEEVREKFGEDAAKKAQKVLDSSVVKEDEVNGTVGLVFKKPLNKKAKKAIEQMPPITIVPATETSYDGDKVKHHFLEFDEVPHAEPIKGSLADFMKGRNSNQRTYQNPKIPKG